MRIFIVMLVMVLTLSLAAGAAMAGSPFKELCLKVMGVTGKTVQKEVNTVGRGIKKSGDVVMEEAKDVGNLTAGKSTMKDVMVKPVKGAAETAGETAYGVVNAPIEASEEIK